MPETLDAFALFSSLVAKPVFVLMAVLGFVKRPADRSASQNHWLLVAAMIVALCTVFLAPFLPALGITVLPQSVLHWTEFSLSRLLQNSSARNIAYGALGIYFLGASWRFCYLSISIIEAEKLKHTASGLSPSELGSCKRIKKILDEHFGFAASRVTIKTSHRIHGPMALGYRSATILLPHQALLWQDARLQRVLAHEYAHIARCDWGIKLLNALATALLWFLPPVWWVAQRVNWYAEIACDNHVTKWLNCRAEYADDLMVLASEAKHHAFALAYSESSLLYERIKVVLDPCENRASAAGVWRVCVLSLMCALVAPLALARLQPAGAGYYSDPIAVYPQPVAVPMVIVPENSPLADTQRRLAWINRQLDLNRPRVQTPEAVDTTARQDLDSLVLKPWAYQPRMEESVVKAPISDTATVRKPVGVLVESVAAPEIQVPEISVSGYLPQRIVTPAYPRLALHREITGRVVVQFDIDEQGRVIAPRIISAHPRGYFEREVLKAIQQFEFMPLQLNGEKIITKNVVETFVFTLEG